MIYSQYAVYGIDSAQAYGVDSTWLNVELDHRVVACVTVSNDARDWFKAKLEAVLCDNVCREKQAAGSRPASANFEAEGAGKSGQDDGRMPADGDAKATPQTIDGESSLNKPDQPEGAAVASAAAAPEGACCVEAAGSMFLRHSPRCQVWALHDPYAPRQQDDDIGQGEGCDGSKCALPERKP